jgi:hypothetical protein
MQSPSKTKQGKGKYHEMLWHVLAASEAGLRFETVGIGLEGIEDLYRAHYLNPTIEGQFLRVA